MKRLAKFFFKPNVPTTGEPPPGVAFYDDNAGAAADLLKVRVEEIQIEPQARIALFSDPSSPGADRLRLLRMQLRDLQKVGKLRSILVTSALPGDGKSTVALNLATALAEGGKQSVLLLDADFYHPTLANTLKVHEGGGLAACLESDVDPMSMLRRIEPLGWYLLPAGQVHGHPTELVQSAHFTQIIQRLSRCFDWVLIDSPPVMPLTDAISISQKVDACLLVVRAGHTPRKAIDDAIALLDPKQILGIILNHVEGLNKVYSKYYGYYHR
jgi:capsular exopolysaccharide synthesis family protein